jgi:AsmA protein
MKKKLAIAVGAAVAIVVAAALALSFIVSPDSYKGEIAARVRAATGRELRIAGPLSLSFLPRLAIEAADVSLGGAAPPGGAASDIFHIGKLAVAVELLPLLSGELRIDKFILTEPKIALEIDAGGKPNWNLAPAEASGSAAPTAALAALARLHVAALTIEHGELDFTDRRSGVTQRLDDAEAALTLPGMDQPFALKGSAQWHGEKIVLTATLDAPGALTRPKGSSPFAVSLRAPTLAADFKGVATPAAADAAQFAILDGIGTIKIESTRDFLHWVAPGIALPPGGLGALAVSGKTHLENFALDLAETTIALDAIAATGSARLEIGGAKPSLTGKIAVEALDLTPYLPINASRGLIELAAPAQWSDAPLDVAALATFDARIEVAAKTIRLRRIAVGDVAATMQIHDGKAQLDLAHAALYGGSAQGGLTVQPGDAGASVAMNIALSQIELRGLSRDAGLNQGLAGTLAYNFTGSSRGRSARDWVANLEGKGNFRIAGGAVEGVDLAGMLKNSSSAYGGGGATAIQRLGGSFTLSRSIVRNNDLAVETGGITAKGAGTVNLVTHAVDYRVTPQLIAGIVTVPVLVAGTWDHLSYAPDIAGIATGLVRTPGKIVGGVGEGVGSTLKGLLGQ